LRSRVRLMAGSTPAAAGRIFISYRRSEADFPAGWLYDHLVAQFGRDQVFKDVDSIEPGEDFAEVIADAVGSCDVLLVLIGDRWLTISDEDGKRRLDDPSDLIRLEIEAALARNVRVIPILVGRTGMPPAEQLPASLVRLARRQALELSPSRFKSDMARLLRALDKTLVEEQARRGVEEPPNGRVDAGGAGELAGAVTVEDEAGPPVTPRAPVPVDEPAGGSTSAGRGPVDPAPARQWRGRWSVRALRARPRSLGKLAAVLLVAIALVVAIDLIARRQALAEVPDLAGSTTQSATERLKRSKLPFEIRSRPDTASEGTVLETEPPAGTTLARGEVVVVYVSSGPSGVAVPPVSGKQEDEAKRLLRAAGFTVKEVPVPDADEEDGVVIGTDPPAGSLQPKGSTVKLKVSARGKPVPDLSGDSVATAERALKELGLRSKIQRDWSATVPADRVIRTAPPAGQLVASGGEVVLVVSGGPAPATSTGNHPPPPTPTPGTPPPTPQPSPPPTVPTTGPSPTT
jgi:beta-lactam-binding protein with PASTA domain